MEPAYGALPAGDDGRQCGGRTDPGDGEESFCAAKIKRTTIKRSRDDSRDLFVFNRRQENRRFVVLKDMII